jgi:autotransporter-associated beta strand protein
MQTTSRFISNGFSQSNVGGTMILGTAGAASTITLPTTTALTLSLAALSGPIVVNDVIQQPAATTGNVNINPNNGDNLAVTLNGASTYTGTTTIGGGAAGGGIVLIGVSSVGASGPFGTGTVIMNQTSTPPNLIPITADQTVANAITLTSGFFAASATAAQDATGPHNLTLTGPITLGSTGRVVTNNMVAGVALTLGSSTTPSTLTLGSTLTIQSQQTGAGTGTTIINDAIGGAGGLTVQGGTVQLNNANGYAGATSVTGGRLAVNNTSGSGTGSNTVSVTGSGTVGSGGTLGGTGTISGQITISSTTAASQGGTIAPGNSAGTLNVGAMVWNPAGQYAFEHSATDTTSGGGVNDFINGSLTLDLSALAAAPFNVNLIPLSSSSALTQRTYTVATFTGGITGAGGVPGAPFSDGTDVSNLFTLSGAFASNPASFATIVGPVGGPQMLQLTFTPVPEPAHVLLLCGAAAGIAGWRRRRRNHNV